MPTAGRVPGPDHVAAAQKTVFTDRDLRLDFDVLQIVFNEISAAEVSQLDTLEQLELFDEFKVTEEDLEHLDDERFGKLEREGKSLYRFRSKDWRFYFEVVDGQVIVHRVLHANTFQDFLYRSKLPVGEDEALAKSKQFWRLIDEGRQARPAK